jgi:hypothetical protein
VTRQSVANVDFRRNETLAEHLLTSDVVDASDEADASSAMGLKLAEMVSSCK